MAEGQPQLIYGINDIRGYSRSTGESLFHLRVLGDFNSEFSAEIEKLMGGSQPFPFATAIKTLQSSLKITVREYTPDLTSILLGGTLTEYSADSNGDQIELENVTGTSAYSAVIGIASVGLNDADEMKEGWYLFKATDSTHGLVYAYSSANFARGTNEAYENADGLITAASVTITTDTSTTVSNFGFKFIGGSSVGMTASDTCRFYIQKPHGGAWKVKFGSNATTFDDIGIVIGAQVVDDETTFLHFYKCKVAGMSIPFKEKGFSEYEISVEPSYDATEDAIGEIRHSIGE